MADWERCRRCSTSSDRRRSPKCSALAVVPSSDISPAQDSLSLLPAWGGRRFGTGLTLNDGRTSIFLCQPDARRGSPPSEGT